MKREKDSLCWDCKNATCSGCSWSKEFKPVAGWKAEKILKDPQTFGETYKVKSCPKFEPDDYFFLKELVKARYGVTDHTVFDYLQLGLIDENGYYLSKLRKKRRELKNAR